MVVLRPIERALLQRLYAEQGGVVCRERLLVDVWGYAPASGTRTLEATVARLRRRLGDPLREALVTVHGVGYALVRLPPPAPPPGPGWAAWLDPASDWIASHPGGWLTVVGEPGVDRRAFLVALARRDHGGASPVYIDAEVEGMVALRRAVTGDAGPRLVFGELGALDPAGLGMPEVRAGHTVVVGARAPLDDRREAVLARPMEAPTC